MIILRQKSYSLKKDREEFQKETDKIAEKLNKEIKKLPKKDQEKAIYLYNVGGQVANRAKYLDETKWRLPGRIIGTIAGYKIGNELAEKRGKKNPALIGIASGYVGGRVLARIGQRIGQKHSDNVFKKKIRGNEEDIKAYMKMTPKERREFEKTFNPADYYYKDSLTREEDNKKEDNKKSSKKIRSKRLGR